LDDSWPGSSVSSASLIPKSTSGRRVKTDSRDAEQLARLLRSGDRSRSGCRTRGTGLPRGGTGTVRGQEGSGAAPAPAGQAAAPLGLRPPVSVSRWSKPYGRWLVELSHPLRDLQTVLDDYRSALWAAEERLAYLEKQMSEAARSRPQLALLVALQISRVGELTSA